MRTYILMAFLFCLGPAQLSAQNVDLVTLPKRDTVQLTIYNSEDLTLVKETRAVTLKRGSNRLQFSWAGTLIDPTSVELYPLEHQGEIDVVDTTFPGQKPQHLIWNIESDFEGQALMQVSYFTSGLTWSMDYVAVCDPGETELLFDGHVRVFNNSGEEYENAEVRLIVGKINLVEKITVLARRQGIADPNAQELGKLRNEALGDVVSKAEGLGAGGGAMDNAKKVVKEGVSEYFMFSVEGSETIPNGWSKRMPAVNADKVSFQIVYRMRSYQYGPRPVRFFLWKNNKESELGESPLPNGVVRVFRKNGSDGLSYLGQQVIQYTPVTDEIEVNLGADDLVVFKQTRTGTRRNNFQFDNRRRVVIGWDEHQDWDGEIRNYRDKPITIEVRLQLDGDVEMTTTTPATSFDYRTVEMTLDADKAGNARFPFKTTLHHGTNAKQSRVRLISKG